MPSAVKSSVLDKAPLAVEPIMHVETLGLSRTTRLVNDLALTRRGRLKLAMSLEAVIDVELVDDVVERFVDLGDVVDYFSYRYFRDTAP